MTWKLDRNSVQVIRDSENVYFIYFKLKDQTLRYKAIIQLETLGDEEFMMETLKAYVVHDNETHNEYCELCRRKQPQNSGCTGSSQYNRHLKLMPELMSFEVSQDKRLDEWKDKEELYIDDSLFSFNIDNRLKGL